MKIRCFSPNISAIKRTYQHAYCHCTRKHEIPNWCEKWSSDYNKSFCILDGGLRSKFCPDVLRLSLGGRKVDDYLSSDPSICNESARKCKVSK